MGIQFNKRFLVLLLSAAYLFVALTHIVLIQRYSHHKENTSFKLNLIFKRQAGADALRSLKISLKHIDKNIREKNKNIRQLIITHVSSFFLLLTVNFNKDSFKSEIPFLNSSPPDPPLLCCFRL